jgi:hypothetical protein
VVHRRNHRLRFFKSRGGLFVDPAVENPLTRLYVEFTSISADYPAVTRECEDTTIAIPLGQWRNEFGGEMYKGGTLALTKLMARFPVCLLIREEGTR